MDFNSKIKSFKKFDIIICSGVISIFDDLKVFFNNINKIKKKIQNSISLGVITITLMISR